MGKTLKDDTVKKAEARYLQGGFGRLGRPVTYERFESYLVSLKKEGKS